MPLLLFATVCTKDRGIWLATEEVRAVLHDIWQQDATTWLVGPYVIMPDHLHFLCVPRQLSDGVEMERWVAYWKDRFSKRFQNPLWRWQRGVFHHRMRHDGHLHETLAYMQQNPVKKGLVATAEVWPWRGKVHDIFNER
ncbi:hypothetical protein BH11VER1_BH11VER1_26190 [soil metagenome]